MLHKGSLEIYMKNNEHMLNDVHKYKITTAYNKHFIVYRYSLEHKELLIFELIIFEIMGVLGEKGH
jgi:hypothetical protein